MAHRPFLLHFFLVVALLVALIAGAWLALGTYATAPGPAAMETTLIITPGTRGATLAQQLAEANVVRFPLALRVLSFTRGFSHKLQAGEYAFPPAASPMTVLTMMSRGMIVVHQVTVPEGWTSGQVAEALRAADALSGDMPADIAEGSILPDTYRYQRNESRAALLGRMQKARQDFLASAWDKRGEELAVSTPEEALTLASIVEKETGLPEERPLVASVFSNRLRLNMKLQADPTVSYGITLGKNKLPHALTLDDLARDTPYNSYTREGLPPGPICNPGRAALEAVLHPPVNDLLYFVAEGTTGGHLFAATLAEHNANVAAYHARLGR